MLRNLMDKIKFKKQPKEGELADETQAPHNFKTTKFRARHFALPDGAAWNPLRGYPVNKPCYCGSQTKAKKCCLPYLSQCISVPLANEIKKNWKGLLAGTYKLPPAPKGEA